MGKPAFPDVVYIAPGHEARILLDDTLGMINDVLKAKGINLYFFIIESQNESSIITWKEDD